MKPLFQILKILKGIQNYLYDRILKPGLQKLPENISSISIIPDDALNLLPFELLLVEKTNNNTVDFSPDNLSYLFEDYAISYNYSATLMCNENKQLENYSYKEKYLGMAPSFGGEYADTRACQQDNLYSLFCNKNETTAIQNIWDGEIYNGELASLETFIKESPFFEIIHLATHACLNEESPMLNKIFFTDSSIAQVDLNQLKLNAKLTVLSACNTGEWKDVSWRGGDEPGP